MSQIKKTDPRIRIAKLREDQQLLLSTVAKHKKEIEITLQQLKALNGLIAQAVDEMEVQDFESTIHQERKEREEVIASLDQVVEQTKQELQQQNASDQNEYISLNAQQLSVATTENSINRLYELAEQKYSWNDEQAKEFFTIQDAVTTSIQYNLAPSMQEAVAQTYEAVKTVRNIRGQDIKQNYLAPATIKPLDTTLFKPQEVQQYKAADTKKTLNDVL